MTQRNPNVLEFLALSIFFAFIFFTVILRLKILPINNFADLMIYIILPMITVMYFKGDITTEFPIKNMVPIHTIKFLFLYINFWNLNVALTTLLLLVLLISFVVSLHRAQLKPLYFSK